MAVILSSSIAASGESAELTVIPGKPLGIVHDGTIGISCKNPVGTASWHPISRKKLGKAPFVICSPSSKIKIVNLGTTPLRVVVENEA